VTAQHLGQPHPAGGGKHAGGFQRLGGSSNSRGEVVPVR
jgi:hypothetical protein